MEVIQLRQQNVKSIYGFGQKNWSTINLPNMNGSMKTDYSDFNLHLEKNNYNICK